MGCALTGEASEGLLKRILLGGIGRHRARGVGKSEAIAHRRSR